ncbi:MAG: lipopolysaccharide biosynthesis protein [Coriobacteriia bacterium]|nr:lipopolysaccharide biosynthesis protein [Coriobacteriia bacterium]
MQLRRPTRKSRPIDEEGESFTTSIRRYDPRTRTRREDSASRRADRPRKESALRQLMNSWWDRLLGGVSSRSFSQQEAQYSSHNTKRDFMWNSIGLAAWGMVFPMLTIVVTQLVGLELAGMFSLAFVTATLLMIIANYGVRTFQVSDLEESHSFSDYQVSRWITCAAMIAIGLLYCNLRGYTGDMFLISIGVYLYKMVDGLADVYEGRLQQMHKLYLAGISQTIRSGSVFIIFSLFLLISGNLGGACIAMGVTAIVSFILVTAPLALLETPASRKASFASIKRLFVECAPLFVALFMYAFIDNMPKFMMEGTLSYDNQLFFNALYFPAQAILMTVGLIYKPLLVKMAAAWADVEHRNRFDLFIVVMVIVILAITGVAALLMNWIGIPIMSFLYGTDFEPYRQLSLIMLAAGGVTGIIDFLYQVITVLRKQAVVMRLYLMTFVCSLFVPVLMISMTGLTGAVISYLVLMSILLVLLLWEYVSVRIEYVKNPEAEEPMTDVPLGETTFSDNALMVQNGSMYLGAYPAAYTGVKPAKSSGEGRARRMAASARRAAQQGARKASESARRQERAQNAQLFEDSEDAFSAAELDAEMQAQRAKEATRQADAHAANPVQDGGAASPAPTDSMAVADVSTGRKRDAGSAFRREMAARVDHAEGVSADDYADADSLADGWPNEFQTPRGE